MVNSKAFKLINELNLQNHLHIVSWPRTDRLSHSDPMWRGFPEGREVMMSSNLCYSMALCICMGTVN